MSLKHISPTSLKVVNANNSKVYKVIVLGDSGVGKTSLTYKFSERKCLEEPLSTIGVDFRERTLTIDGEDVKLQLWDTAGQERFREALIQNYYRNLDAVIFVYDVSSLSSFTSLKYWIEEVNKNCNVDVPRILVGNKCDMKAVVNTNDARIFADHYDLPLFETSSIVDSECDNVDAIFFTLAHKLKNHKPMIRRCEVLNISSNNNSPSDSKSGCCS